MRELEPFRITPLLAKNQEIQIQRPRRVSRRNRLASVLLLERFQICQQGLRSQSGARDER